MSIVNAKDNKITYTADSSMNDDNDPLVYSFSRHYMPYDGINRCPISNNPYIVAAYWTMHETIERISSMYWAWTRIKVQADNSGVKSFDFEVPCNFQYGSKHFYYVVLSERYKFPGWTVNNGTPAFWNNANKQDCSIQGSGETQKLIGSVTTTIPANTKKYFYIWYHYTDPFANSPYNNPNAHSEGGFGSTITFKNIVSLTKPDIEIYDGTKFTRYEPYIYTGNGTNQGWKLAKPYIYTGSGTNQGWKEAGN